MKRSPFRYHNTMIVTIMGGLVGDHGVPGGDHGGRVGDHGQVGSAIMDGVAIAATR